MNRRAKIVMTLVAGAFFAIYIFQFIFEKEEDKSDYKKRLAMAVDSINHQYSIEKSQEENKWKEEDNKTEISNVNSVTSSPPINVDNSNAHNSNQSFHFSSDDDLYEYLAGKTFYSKDHTIKVSISNVVTVNGNPAFFNLKFVALSANLGMVTGQSMSVENPNLVIKIRIHPDEGSIDFKGDYLYINP